MKFFITSILLFSVVFGVDYKEDLKFSLFTLHGIGPKSLGRGNTGVAVLDEETITYYNSAGLAFVKKEKAWISLTYASNWYGYAETSIKELSTGCNLHLGKISLGGLFSFFEWAREKGEISYGEAKTLKILGFGSKINPSFAIGCNLKQVVHKYSGILQEKISEGKAIDISGFYKFNDKINYGLNLQNVISSEENLLKNYKFGVSYKFPLLLSSFDLDYLEQYGISPYFGIEIPKDELIFRLGIYRSWPYQMVDQKVFFYTGGIDFKTEKISLTYGIALFWFDQLLESINNQLGVIHRLSIQLKI